jgi:UDP-N-acetylmuramoyl-tripeptide--D-alanyl-D-alanine ligase
VGVAGSYGKTTMKEVLKQVVSCKLKVVSTPESVNTPVGIARFVLNRVTPDTRILILELGEHYRGDVKELCQIAPPDVSVITGINEAHLERMGSLDNIIATIFEAVEFAKEDSLIILNADDKNVDENYQKFVKQGQKVKEFQISNFKFEKFNQEKLCWEAEAEGLGKIEINLLGEYALSDAAAAIIAAKHLGLSDQEIKMGFLNVKPVEHRLQPIPSAGGVLVIDDSYNGNPEGAKEAIAVLSRFTNRRKIYITPGLVEMGGAAPEIHRQLGKQLAGVADVVILVKDSVTQWIEEGIRNAVIARSASDEAILSENRLPRPSAALGARNDKPIVIWFNTAQEAHEGLKNIIKPGDVVLFQNDWGDQYI